MQHEQQGELRDNGGIRQGEKRHKRCKEDIFWIRILSGRTRFCPESKRLFQNENNQ
jgi:hypothetical protein